MKCVRIWILIIEPKPHSEKGREVKYHAYVGQNDYEDNIFSEFVNSNEIPYRKVTEIFHFIIWIIF